jgi:hypothetical protein
MTSAVTREQLSDGAVMLRSPRCTFVYRRPRPGVLLVAISGDDDGQFGATTLDEIRLELLRERPLSLFVDARAATGAAVSVSDAWKRFFEQNRKDLSAVLVLAPSRFVHLTVEIAKHLSRTGDLIDIVSDPAVFDARLQSALR